MDPILFGLPIGASVSLVARIDQQLAPELYNCVGVSPSQRFELACAVQLSEGTITCYDLVKISHEPLRLGTTDESALFPKHGMDYFKQMVTIDLCSGMGGFALGSRPLGIETVAFLDSNALACQVLRDNFSSPVIQGSVCDLACVKQLHALTRDAFLQVTGGYPCQPFSRQGDMQGLRDARGNVLPAILHGSWLLQADSILLECVDHAANFAEIHQLLDSFVSMTGMSISKLVFDLQAQWPVRRRRFWCHLLRGDLPELQLLPWDSSSLPRTLGDIIPFDAIWSDAHELDLTWDSHEMAIYFDEAYGNDIRVLQQHHITPTMLHSWANLLRACPCGCRGHPLSHQRLRHGGARGFGLVSAKTSQVRHFHSEEAAILCTVPLDFHFPEPPRTALCLLGQIAAPAQVLWLQSQLLAHLQQHFWIVTELSPQHILQNYLAGLMQQCAQRWTLARMFLPRSIQVSMEGIASMIQVSSPITVHELEHAETALIGHGYYVTVHHHDQRLPGWCKLHGGIHYMLKIHRKQQARPTSVMSQAMASSMVLGAGTGTDEKPIGLGDTQIWKGMKLLLDFLGASSTQLLPFVLYPFRAHQLLRLHLPDGVQNNWRHRYALSNGDIMVVFEHARHWLLLVGRKSTHLTWTCYDGLDLDFVHDHLTTAHAVALKLSECLQQSSASCSVETLVRQRAGHTCGSIALQHMALCLGIHHQLPLFDELLMHHFFAAGSTLAPSLTALGKNLATDALALLLASKGVHEDLAVARATQVRDKLGHVRVQNILQESNPWAALKAAASQPGKMFRLVTEAEQKTYIEKRAQTKHGAKVSNARHKKNVSMQRGHSVQLDPTQFQLDAQHFQDGEGRPVHQIDFQEVGADQSGIALCTTSMARHFLENPTAISLHGLALLIIDSPSVKVIQDAGLQPMIFPALCLTTDEHTIIMGQVLQLGDSHVKRKMAGKESEPERVDTQVIKLQVYRDQLEMAWNQFAQSPVRALLQMTQALQLCKGQSCGVDCPKHHQDVDESLDAVILEVWSRAFMDDLGKKAASDDATMFTVFMRIPESALLKLMSNVLAGVYVEPRGKQPREQDDKFRVVWLPGASYDEASHQSRTFSKSLCLVRLKTKYGIRVRKGDEASAWSKLRPGIDFVDMSIQKIYELFPMPHGTQRHAVTQILQDWEWQARALQPGKGNFHHMAWRVGSATPPPASIMTAFGGDIIITAIKDLQVQETKPTIYATPKTHKHLRDKPTKASSSTETTASTNVDPWIAADPWGGYEKKIPTTSNTAGKTYRAELQEQIRQDINIAFQDQLKARADDMTDDSGPCYTTETEQSFVALESGISELKQQNGQFMQWFQQTGERMQQHESLMQEVQTTVQSHAGALQQLTSTVSSTEAAIGEVHQTLNVHQQEIHSMGNNFKTAVKSMKDELSDEMMNSFNQQYGKLEALLEKRHKAN